MMFWQLVGDVACWISGFAFAIFWVGYAISKSFIHVDWLEKKQ